MNAVHRSNNEDERCDGWLTTMEVARHIRKPMSWIHQNAERVGMPRCRLGNQYRYRISEIDAWLEAQHV